MTIWLRKKICNALLKISHHLGNLSAVCIFTMMIIQTATVIFRYVFSEGSIALQESAIYAHATAFMIATGFALQQDKHVRVDVFYRNMSPTSQRWVNTFGFFLCLAPLCLMLMYVSQPFIDMAWSLRERSPEAGGIAYLYILKTLVIVMPITTLISGASQLALEWMND